MLYGFNLSQANQDVSLEDFTEQKKKAKLRLDNLKVKRYFFYHATNSRVVQCKEKRRFLPYCVDKCLSDTNENPNLGLVQKESHSWANKERLLT